MTGVIPGESSARKGWIEPADRIPGSAIITDMERAVLVLNANYEPIHVTNLQRAVCLMLMEKATLVVNGSGDLHSVRQSFPIPSVIRLNTMVNRPRPKVCLSRREVFRRDHYTCQYCGKQTQNLTIDHVIPRRLNGPHSWENVVTACSICNHRKGGRSLEEAGMKLLRRPVEPPSNAAYRLGGYISIYKAWEPFISGW